MDTRTVLTKALALAYRSKTIKISEYDNLIKTVLDTIRTEGPEFNFNGSNYVKKLKEFILDILTDEELLAKEVLTQTLSIMLENDTKLLSVVKESIDLDYDESNTKRIIASLVKVLNNYYRENIALDVLSKANYDLKFNRGKITNFSEYLRNTINSLEPLANMISTINDPGLVDEIDFEDPDSLNRVFNGVKNINNNKHIYKFGWQALNKMTQGGIRRGEFCTVAALQHKYKTGMSLSMFMQIALHNSPIVTDKEVDKKPLLLRISFEDSLINNLQFMYQYLKASDSVKITKEDFDHISANDMTKYVLDKLTSTGFHIKMLRVDPNQWTYSSVINKVIELEAQGYCVHLLMLDYVTLLPTTGCAVGPVGSDRKDLIRRIRNFCSGRNISFITPLQMSSEAKMLLRSGVPEHELPKQVAEKGYYDGCKSLDQDIDLELFIHLFTHKKKKYLAISRGKHRISTVIAEESKYLILRFPDINTPILGDLDREDSSYTKLPNDTEDSSSSVLSELLE